MASVNLTCVICTEFYKNSDTIVSTNCGHVFHSHCLEEWRMRSGQCPTCLGTTLSVRRIFLNFEEDSCEKFVELKSKIDQHIKQNSVLQQQLDQSERDFLQLHKDFTKKSDDVKELYQKNEYLSMQNATKSSEIEVKTIEIHKLRETLNSANPQASTIMLQEEINVLKEKNKQISNELNKEIRNGIQLSVDKMKLESKLDQYEKSMSSLSSSSAPASATASSRSQDNSKNMKKNKNKNAEPQRDSSQTAAVGFQTNRGCPQSVVIKNITNKFDDEDALKNYVIKLTQLMNLCYNGDDMEKVSVMERKQETISLIVKFKSINLKIQFLKLKERLKHHEETKNLLIYEYIGDNTNSLFHYAKTLKPLGFKHVYIRNNIVFVRKDDGSEPKRIRNHDDVNKLRDETQNPFFSLE